MFKSAGVVDVSYQTAVRVSGSEATGALDHLTVANIADLAPGVFCRTLWCTDEGHVVGDGLVLCEDAQNYIVVTRAPCVTFIDDSCAAFACTVTRADDFDAGLELIGPAAASVLEGAGFVWAPALHPGSFVTMSVRGLTVRVACLDKIGTPGYAIWTSREHAPLLWDRLRRAGGSGGLTAVGTLAHTTLRLEHAEPAYGLDYIGALVAPSWRLMVTPEALGAGIMVAAGKNRFNGSTALAKGAAAPRVLVPLTVEGTGTLAPAFITAEGLPVGHVTSAAWSPRFGCGLVLAWIEAESASLTNGLRLVSPVRGALGQLTDANRDGRVCHPYKPR